MSETIKEPRAWGKIALGTRLEKMVEADFVMAWSGLLMRGLRKGDAVLLERGKPAHEAANGLIRRFLKTSCDSLMFLDSDADVGEEFISELRDYAPGWVYDGLQAFYCRRGWPPEAIWFKEAGGVHMACMVIAEGTEDVAMVGTHAAIFRREVFETIYREMGQGIPINEFQWFCYPRHKTQSDESQLSWDARQMGFRLGATTAVKAGHIGRVTTGWETYQEYLELSGTRERTEARMALAALVGQFTGESMEQVIGKAALGSLNVSRAWEEAKPQGALEERWFYANTPGYLYDLVGWNSMDQYRGIIQRLEKYHDQYALVIGPGLGQEVSALSGFNLVESTFWKE